MSDKSEIIRELSLAQTKFEDEANIDLRNKVFAYAQNNQNFDDFNNLLSIDISKFESAQEALNMFFIKLCGYSLDTLKKEATEEEESLGKTLISNMESDDEPYHKIGAHIRESLEHSDFKNILSSFIGGDTTLELVLKSNTGDFYNNPSFFATRDTKGDVDFAICGKSSNPGEFYGVVYNNSGSKEEHYYHVGGALLIEDTLSKKHLIEATDLEFVGNCEDILESKLEDIPKLAPEEDKIITEGDLTSITEGFPSLLESLYVKLGSSPKIPAVDMFENYEEDIVSSIKPG